MLSVFNLRRAAAFNFSDRLLRLYPFCSPLNFFPRRGLTFTRSSVTSFHLSGPHGPRTPFFFYYISSFYAVTVFFRFVRIVAPFTGFILVSSIPSFIDFLQVSFFLPRLIAKISFVSVNRSLCCPDGLHLTVSPLARTLLIFQGIFVFQTHDTSPILY